MCCLDDSAGLDTLIDIVAARGLPPARLAALISSLDMIGVVTAEANAERLRRARATAGLSQTALAAASGVSQPNIAAFENGGRKLSDTMLRRLLTALDARPSTALQAHRADVLAVARRHGATNIRIFGSVARGEDDVDSDVDLLATFAPGTTLYDLADLVDELEALLGSRVDVVSDRGLAERHAAIAREAVAL